MDQIAFFAVSGFPNKRSEKKNATKVAPACVSNVSSDNIDIILMRKNAAKRNPIFRLYTNKG